MMQPDEILRSKRKTLTIAVDSFGRLIVRAPYFYPQSKIEEFLRAKEAWILRKKAERAGAGIQLPPENLHGYELLLLGKKTEIQLTNGNKIAYDKVGKTLFLPQKNAKNRLVKWLKENAERIFSELTAKTALEMGVEYKSVSVSSARSRWGSCSAENRINYSFRLIYAPKEVIEYVVIHELAHVRNKNHSSAFWREVEKYVPDWKTKRKWLKIHSGLMQVL